MAQRCGYYDGTLNLLVRRQVNTAKIKSKPQKLMTSPSSFPLAVSASSCLSTSSLSSSSLKSSYHHFHPLSVALES